jgi:hypothetical protein
LAPNLELSLEYFSASYDRHSIIREPMAWLIVTSPCSMLGWLIVGSHKSLC